MAIPGWIRPLIRTTPASGRYIPALDGLRGFAVLIVLVGHGTVHGMYLYPGSDMHQIGKTGVFLFFILSSFLLTSQLLNQTQRYGATNLLMWFNYLARRFLRIFPAYVVFLLVIYLVGGRLHAWSISWHVTQQSIAMQRGVHHLWSIPVEFKFYFLLPLALLLIVLILRRSVTATIVSMAIFVVWATQIEHLSADRDSVVNFLPTFAIGVCLAVVHRWWTTTEVKDARLVRWALEATVVGTLLFWVATIPSVWSLIVGHDVARGYWVDHRLLFALVWAAALFGTVHGAGYVRRVFEWQGLKVVGVISFAVYLWHPLVMLAMEPAVDDIPPQLGLVLATAVSMAIAVASYLLIEHHWLSITLAKPQARTPSAHQSATDPATPAQPVTPLASALPRE
ncbi:MAG: acyltransferase family protein [Nocardioidaceae bacterium]